MDRTAFIIKNFEKGLMQANSNDNKGYKTIKGLVNNISSIDPTPNKRYLTWLSVKYSQGKFRLEDAGRVSSALENFTKYSNRLSVKDINRYETVSQIEDAVEQFIGTATSKRAEIRELKSEGVNKIVDTPKIKIFQLLTEEAAKYYGSGTRWCTAADNHNTFDSYKDGLFVILIGDRKWQLHIGSEQFMDERDDSISDKDLALICEHDEYTVFINNELRKIYTIVDENPVLEEDANRQEKAA